MGKATLKEVHSYAELKKDNRAPLPESFTLCSSIMTTGCRSYRYKSFFTILFKNKSQFLTPLYNQGVLESILGLGFQNIRTNKIIGQVSPLFPNQWSRSCTAVNTTSGLITWVVEGTLVLTKEYVELKTPTIQGLSINYTVARGVGH